MASLKEKIFLMDKTTYMQVGNNIEKQVLLSCQIFDGRITKITSFFSFGKNRFSSL